MEQILKALSSASGTSIAVAVAIALMGGTALLLPRGDRRSLRLPFGFFIAHLIVRGIELLLEDGSAMAKAASIINLGALLICIGRTSVLLVIDVILGRRLERQLPKIIRDIIQGVVYFLLLLGLLRQLGLEPGQLLTTSALLTAVIGLSLQDTLGNLIAGLSVQIQQPFSVGDWIQFDSDPKHVGKVVEINWRATTLLTLDEMEVVVPNGTLAKAALRVYTRPTRLVRRSVFIGASYDVPPRKVVKTILAAVKDAPNVLKEPAPTVVLNDYKDSAIEYWLRFYIDQFGRRDIIDGDVRERIWYAFRRAHIEIPFPQHVVHMQEQTDETRAADRDQRIAKRERALQSVDFLKVITDQQRRDLADKASIRVFSPGERIVTQGDDSTELFLILSGETSVVLESEGTETEITRLGASQFFGEMALLTGENRKATVKAVRECELLVIDHDTFEGVLQKQPEAVEELSRVLAERKLQLDEHNARLSGEERKAVVQRESSQLIGKIRRLFKLGN